MRARVSQMSQGDGSAVYGERYWPQEESVREDCKDEMEPGDEKSELSDDDEPLCDEAEDGSIFCTKGSGGIQVKEQATD